MSINGSVPGAPRTKAAWLSQTAKEGWCLCANCWSRYAEFYNIKEPMIVLDLATRPILPAFTNLTQLSIGQLLTEIIGECKNGCTDANSTLEHFARLKKSRGLIKDKEDSFKLDERILLVALVDSINFAGLREMLPNWEEAIKTGIR